MGIVSYIFIYKRSYSRKQRRDQHRGIRGICPHRIYYYFFLGEGEKRRKFKIPSIATIIKDRKIGRKSPRYKMYNRYI